MVNMLAILYSLLGIVLSSLFCPVHVCFHGRHPYMLVVHDDWLMQVLYEVVASYIATYLNQ